jgi:hypothetical protein
MVPLADTFVAWWAYPTRQGTSVASEHTDQPQISVLPRLEGLRVSGQPPRP